MEALDHKCPSCTATLPFDPTLQKWKCSYCGSEYTLEELEKYENAKNADNSEKTNPSNDVNLGEDSTIDVDVYECQSCGAKILTDENTTATFCVYCGNTAIIKNRLTGTLRPTKIIPFKNTKEEAIKTFVNYRKGKPFAPKDFSNKENIEKITGVYIPFWIYDCEVAASLEAVGKNIKTWTSGDYQYTKTDTYKVLREGNMNYEKVPTDASSKFDDDIMDSIEPFNYNDLADFNMSYLSGFLSEKYDVEKSEAFERAKTRVVNSTNEKLKETIIGYSTYSVVSSNMNINLKDSNYILLPVWMLNINYRGKVRKFAMNGQTGKMVGDIPIAPSKAISTSLVIFIVSFIILLILNIILIGGIG